MLIGYARVATAAESLEPQQQALDRAKVDQLFADVACGAKVDHPQRKRAFSLLGPGDTLVVWRLDRLDLTIRNLVETIEDLVRRGVGLRSLEENIDTMIDPGKLPSHVFAALLQSERDLIRERKAVKLAAARSSGPKGGRKPKLDEEERTRALVLYNRGLPVDEICAMLQIARSTFFRVRRQENKRKHGKKPKTKERGRKIAENASQAIDSPVRAHADPSSSHPVPARAVVSPRPIAAVPSRPPTRVPAAETAAQPPPHSFGGDEAPLPRTPSTLISVPWKVRGSRWSPQGPKRQGAA